jgi:hypothetical protein
MITWDGVSHKETVGLCKQASKLWELGWFEISWFEISLIRLFAHRYFMKRKIGNLEPIHKFES